MRKRFTRILFILLTLVVFIGAFYLYNSGFFNPKETPVSTDSPSPRPAGLSEKGGPIPVKAIVIQPGSIQDAIFVNGSTVPNEEVLVSSEVAGKITKILFKEGAFVKKGTVLIQLDVAELKAQRERLLVQQQLSRKIAERLEGLYKKEGVSLQEYEIARAEADQVDKELSLIDVQIEKRTIKAPFDGLLGLRQVSEGSYLSPGTAIVNLVSVNPIEIECSVPERYNTNVEVGTTIKFRMDGSNTDYNATVIAKEPNIDPTTRTLRLKASAPNPGSRILPGAFANVTVNLKNFEGTIMIPTEAILPELGGKKVYVYKNGKAQPVDVETGIRNEGRIQVLKGLSPGDTIITTGILQIRPGAEVSITNLN